MTNNPYTPDQAARMQAIEMDLESGKINMQQAVERTAVIMEEAGVATTRVNPETGEIEIRMKEEE